MMKTKNAISAIYMAGLCVIGGSTAAQAETFDFTRITNPALTAAQSQILFNNVATEIGHIGYVVPTNSAEHNGWHESLPVALGFRYHLAQTGMKDTVQSGGSSFASDKITLQAGFTGGLSLGLMVLNPTTPTSMQGHGFEVRYDLSKYSGMPHAHWNVRFTSSTLTGVNDATSTVPVATNEMRVDSTGIGTMLGYSFKGIKPYLSLDVIKYSPTIVTGFTGLKAQTSNGVTLGLGAKVYLAPSVVLGVEYQKMDWTTSTDISFGAEF